MHDWGVKPEVHARQLLRKPGGVSQALAEGDAPPATAGQPLVDERHEPGDRIVER
jgi:hypothetical protein